MIPSERLDLEHRVSEPHGSPVLAQFLALSIEQIDAAIRLNGGGMRFVNSEPVRKQLRRPHDCGFCTPATRAVCVYCEGTGRLPDNGDGYELEDDEYQMESRFFG